MVDSEAASLSLAGILQRLRGALVRNVVVGLVVVLIAAYGLLSPIDHFIGDRRFSLLHRPPTGRVVVVELDSASLQSVGIWPWPRTIYASMVDKLAALGAGQILFDVDFSSVSDPRNDAEFASALRRAPGKVGMAVFEQPGRSEAEPIVVAPIKPLADQTYPVQVDIPTDRDGIVRNYAVDLPLGGRRVSTMATRIAGKPEQGGSQFGIDFSIDPERFDQISAGDVLSGKISASRIKDRFVIVGATAQELHDVVGVPRYGQLPGAYAHALAAETLLQGRALGDAPLGVTAAIVALLALMSAWAERRTGRIVAFALAPLAALAIEAAALGAQSQFALRVSTAPAHVALVAFMLVGLFVELHARRRHQLQTQREREVVRAMLTRVVSDNFDGVVIADMSGKIVAASRPAQDLAGGELEGRLQSERLPPELSAPLGRAIARGAGSRETGPTSGEANVLSATGSKRLLEYVITVSAVAESPGRAVACLTFRDVTDRRAHEARLSYLATHDELTDAWTRARMVESMNELFADPKAKKQGLIVFSLDLRRFAMVNDVFGYKAGDALLTAVVQRLRANGYAMVARLGGDNFAFLRKGEPKPDTIGKLARSLLALINEPYYVVGRQIVVGASLGATTTSISGFDPDTLVTHASMAREAGKRGAGDTFAIFAQGMETERREKQRIDATLRRAIEDGCLTLHYQPKIDFPTGHIVGAEALMRWKTHDGSWIAPGRFIPVAEESSLIIDLGRWALEKACVEAAEWPADITVAVNVSPVQFALADVLGDVKRALVSSGLPARRLEIEITESAFVESDSGVATTLQALRSLGVSVAIDDFGTGYSSLHYFGRLPFDTIKIDQSFVRRLTLDPSADATVAAIVSLAKAHGKLLVAEGVEELRQAKVLTALGCDFGQGYLYSRPIDTAALRHLFAQDRVKVA